MGNSYALRFAEGTGPLKLEGDFLLPHREIPRAREKFISWYKEEAQTIIAERAAHYATLAGLRYRRVQLSHAKKRWGSCSSRGNLRFNWRLVMAPLEAIDYVVVHELAHLAEQNHGRRFWEKVKAMFPDYKKQVDWLKQNQHWMDF